MIRTGVLLIFLFFFENSIIAQPYVDIFSIRHHESPNQPYLDNDSSSLSISQTRISTFLPFVLKNEDAIIFGSFYERIRLKTRKTGLNTFDLHSAILQIGYGKKWNEQWNILLLFLPKISSDWNGISSEDLQIGGIVIATKKINEKFRYKFGLYYNREYFGNLFVPVLGLDWRINKKLNFFGLLPRGLNLEYKALKTIHFGLAHETITTTFRLNGDFNNNYIRDGDRFWAYYMFKFYFNYYPVKNIILSAEFGHTAFRSYQEYWRGTKDKVNEGPFQQSKNAPFINLLLAYRIRFDN
ncbi:MAG: DUF6268 family outer membrane beta-barrel protein [Cytophagales bacterium]